MIAQDHLPSRLKAVIDQSGARNQGNYRSECRTIPTKMECISLRCCHNFLIALETLQVNVPDTALREPPQEISGKAGVEVGRRANRRGRATPASRASQVVFSACGGSALQPRVTVEALERRTLLALTAGFDYSMPDRLGLDTDRD